MCHLLTALNQSKIEQIMPSAEVVIHELTRDESFRFIHS